jgi:hypothetical protein
MQENDGEFERVKNFMDQIRKTNLIKSVLKITLIIWIIVVSATWIILNTYEKIGNSSSIPEYIKKQIVSGGENINKYVCRQYKYAENLNRNSER